MELLVIITLLAVLEYIYFGARVGIARGKYDVQAPAVSGNELFERHYRVHINTLEQMIIFIPGLWSFGYFIGQYWAAALGIIFLAGRLLYGMKYVEDPEKRGVGMLMTVIPSYAMILGGLIGAVVHYLSQ